MTARGSRRGAGLVASLALGILAPLSAAAQEWHELYAGGVAALRSGQPAKAADLLRRAIQKRPQAGRANRKRLIMGSGLASKLPPARLARTRCPCLRQRAYNRR